MYKISQYFPKPSDCFGDNIKVELDSSNYATEADLKGATGVNTTNLASKSKTVPVDLSKLSNGVNNEIVRKNFV